MTPVEYSYRLGSDDRPGSPEDGPHSRGLDIAEVAYRVGEPLNILARVARGNLSDAAILAAMAERPARLWHELFAAADQLENGADEVRWTPLVRESDGSLILPYPIYDPAVLTVERLLYELRVIVSFDWMAWDRSRYPGGAGLANASAAEAARLATAIFRGERFCDGSIADALSDGTLRAVLARLRGWFEAEHPAMATPRNVEPTAQAEPPMSTGRETKTGPNSNA